jgi:hypothetical protein
MKTPTRQLLSLIASIAAAYPVHAADTLATAPATLEMESPATSLSPRLFTQDWKTYGASGGLKAEADGNYPFTLQAGKDGTKIEGKATYVPTADGNVEAVYTFIPESDVVLNALFVGATLPTDVWGGGSWSGDGKEGKMPDELGDLHVMNQTGKKLTLTSRRGKEKLGFILGDGVSVRIQDDRRWGPTFSVRIGYDGGGRTFKAKEPFKVAFTVVTHEAQKLILDGPVTLTAGKDWVPLRQSPDIIPGSALDFSKLGLHDAPAGKHGRVLAKGSHFEFENKPGVPQRFYGVNLCFAANFLEHEDAKKLAARLARTGYNSLRIHHNDGGMVEGAADGTTLNEENMARLDSLMAACIENGLYITTDLYISRSVPWRSVGIDRDGKISMRQYKALVAVHEGTYQNLVNFSRQFLSRVNPHTGRSYAKEPALGWLALVNEGNLGNYLEEMKDIPEWGAAWKEWLAERQKQEPQAYADIPAEIPANFYQDSRHNSAFVLFLKEKEDRLTERLGKFLKDEMKSMALITNRSAWTNRAPDQDTRHSLYDFVDDHFYVDHPNFLEKDWQLPSRCENVNPLKNARMGAQNVVFTRLLDKPFTLTEYNYSGPGRFRGVGGIVTGTMGALQDWGGIWRFAYSHGREGILSKEGTRMGYFDISGDPLSLAAERASICLFLRGDLPVLEKTYAMVLPRKDLLKMRDSIPANSTPWPWISWYAKLGTIVADQAPSDATWSGTYPEVYKQKNEDIRKLVDAKSAAMGDGAVEIDSESGAFTLKTARTAGGFTEKGLIKADKLEVDVGDTAATVWVSSLDGKPISESPRLLLTHLTDVQNTDIRYAQQSRKTLLAWGKLPHLVRNGKADIRLAVSSPSSYKVHALSNAGERVGEIPVKVADGRLVFTAAVDAIPGNATMIYEIVKGD